MLSKTPHLKHCCIGKIDTDQHQILVDGKGLKAAPIGKVVTLKGKLEPYGQGYLLKEAVISEGTPGGVPFASVGMALAGVALFLVYLKKKKK